MNAYLLLCAESLLSLLASVAVLSVLSQPLRNILTKLCPDEQAAQFWLSYTKVMLTIAPLLLVLALDLLTPFHDPLNSVRLALVAILAGLLIGLRVVGNRLSRFALAPKPAWAAP